jgi:hypothetical protein
LIKTKEARLNVKKIFRTTLSLCIITGLLNLQTGVFALGDDGYSGDVSLASVGNYSSVFDAYIEGTPVVGEELTLQYTLDDPAGNDSGLTAKITWQFQTAHYVFNIADSTQATGVLKYTIPESAVGKYVAVNIPVTGIMGNARNKTVGIGPVLAARTAAPSVSTVTIGHTESGAAAVGCDLGQRLTGKYYYTGEAEEGTACINGMRAAV